MSLIGVLDKLEKHEPQPFLAPIPSAQMVSCFTVQDSIPYWFHLRNPQAGWWWIEPGRSDSWLRHQAQPHEYLSYLAQLPRFVVIAVEQRAEGVIVVPYNAADAAQRGWPNSEPRYAYLTREVQLLDFSTIAVRNMAGTLLFDDLYPLDIQQQLFLSQAAQSSLQLQAVPVSFQVAWQIVAARLFNERLEQARLKAERVRQEQMKTERGRFEHHLGFVGASLVTYKKQGERFDVTYTYNGAQFTVNVRPDMRIESAGICLAGGDRNNDLSSIVLTMEQARREHRPDVDRRWHL